MKLGVVIPFLNNSEQAEDLCRNLFLNKLLPAHEKNENILPLLYTDFEEIGCGAVRNIGIDYFINVNKVDFIIFIDSDDDLEDNYLEEVYNACTYAKRDKFNVIETRFVIRKNPVEFKDNDKLPTHCTGIAYSRELLKDIRFNEDLKIGEDEDFNKRLLASHEIRKMYLDVKYIYNLGINKDCLTYRYLRGEIK